MAARLGVRRPSNTGFVILGANGLGRALGRALREAGEEVLFIDSNPDACEAAEAEGFRVLHGSGLEEEIQERAELDTRAGCLGVTSNEEVNLLFARRARKDFKVPRAWVALRREHLGVNAETARRLGAHILFGAAGDVPEWTHRMESGLARVERWQWTGSAEGRPAPAALQQELDGVLPLVLVRARRAEPVDETAGFRAGDQLYLALVEKDRGELEARLRQEGWEPA